MWLKGGHIRSETLANWMGYIGPKFRGTGATGCLIECLSRDEAGRGRKGRVQGGVGGVVGGDTEEGGRERVRGHVLRTHHIVVLASRRESTSSCQRHRLEPGSAVRVADVAIHDLRIHTESVNVALSVYLPDDTLVIVVSQRATELIVAHVPLVLVFAPPDSDGLRLVESELSLLHIRRPLYEVLVLSV